ncbi:hypothetical protein CCAX7_57420 [Capsulimonas corticalis]|uniref:Uncharacterized protein n=1 Tax=Capsulimonas corticalis TaxID=2219043 RepID=A0A402D0E5_9BACT|nr:SpoIIE family protein phosphatase [Capsulimonas corticalis]BDI33691.1 hypothetical protein CCAX7_57420 [Capsulimonas corticalis]
MSAFPNSSDRKKLIPPKFFENSDQAWGPPAVKIAALVAAAAAFRIALNPVLDDRVPFITFFPAIVYGAWLLGWRGGMLATALAALVGSLFIMKTDPNVPGDEFADQFSLLMFLFSGTAVSALGQAQSAARRQGLKREDELRVKAEREALLNEIGQAIRATIDPQEIQQAAVQALGAALQADRCYFATYDYTRDTIFVGSDWSRTNLPAVAGQYRLTDYLPCLDALFASRTTCIAEDTAACGFPSAAEEILARGRLRALIAVPFYDEGRLSAALIAGMADGPRAWTPDEAALMEAAAEQTRTALATALIAQREHAIATKLQDALQPSLPDDIPGLALAEYYKPALSEAAIGGDFYDVFALNPTCAALVVADLSGKGLAAAAQVAIVRNMLRYVLYTDSTLAQSIAALNQTLAGRGLLPGFATLFAGCYDHAAREIRYVNCGQEPALLWRSATGCIEELPATGPVVGMNPGGQFAEQSTSFAPGDVFVIFTDGLTEAGPRRLRLLGVAGVTAILREIMGASLPESPQEKAAAIVARLIASVDAFAESGARDDVCLLVAVAK